MSRGMAIFDLDDTLCLDGADEPFPDVPAALKFLRDHGVLCCVASNAGYWVERVGVGAAAARVHRVAAACGISDQYVAVCAHEKALDCHCRKPEPRMLEAFIHMAFGLSHRFMVGDRWSDILAGQRAGCDTVLVGLDNWPWKPKGSTPLPAGLADPTYIVHDIWGAARLIAGLASL